jgi:hypothetical protein
MTPEWQKRRTAFNHDWFKSQFIPPLARFINLLDGHIEDIEFGRSFVRCILPQWEAHSQEAFALPADFECQMSPQCLFDHPPLSRCEAGLKGRLKRLVHLLWLARYPVRQWVTDATACAEEVDATYHRLQKTLQSCENLGDASALKPFREQFAEFRKQCLALAKAIEKFPGEVYVT